MGAIRQDTNLELHQQITEGNLRRQFDLLRDMVSVGLQIPFGITSAIIDALHVHTTVHLVEKPGRYRSEVARITGSNHSPPAPDQIKQQMLGFVVEIKSKWENEQVFLLAAFAFWKFCWIHPYEDGNGRTARAICYLIICMKHKQWLPGRDTLLIKIKKHRDEYTAALRLADETSKTGDPDLMPLAMLLAKHTTEQISE